MTKLVRMRGIKSKLLTVHGKASLTREEGNVDGRAAQRLCRLLEGAKEGVADDI